MKIRHSFWKNDKQETHMFDVYDNTMPLFNKGDKFYYSVEMMFPVTVTELRKQYKEDFVKSIVTNAEKHEKEYSNTCWKIVSIRKSLRKDNNVREDDKIYRLDIEYKCKRIHWFYWKWWYIKRFWIKLIKKLLFL